MNRRHFLQKSVVLGTSAALSSTFARASSDFLMEKKMENKLPLWRGFNLLEKFYGRRNRPFREWTFQFMAEHGFNFARLPLSYHCWMSSDDWMLTDEPRISNPNAMDDIDQLIEFGKKYSVHINLNMHRIQGYCVNPPAEPLSIWRDEKALAAAIWQWTFFAKRYKGIGNDRLSFDLINEPAGIDEATYVRVITQLVEAIRREDPERLIVADGLEWGTQPVFGLKNLNIGQSTRGYNPMQVSHHKASWVGTMDMSQVPEWTMTINGEKWDKNKLQKDYIKPWQKLQTEGVGIHVGEWGCYRYTPHAVALAWMEDCLSLWKEAGWGWSLWNLQGEFGVINSRRDDVVYETMGDKFLDKKMLNLLKKY